MLGTHQERNDDDHEHGGRLRGTLQRKTGGKGCEDGDSRRRRHPPVRLQGHVAPGTGSGAPRQGRRGAAKDRAEEIQP